MKTYQIYQDGAGTYEIEAKSPKAALRAMAKGIVENTDNWRLQFAAQSIRVACEKAEQTLTIVED